MRLSLLLVWSMLSLSLLQSSAAAAPIDLAWHAPTECGDSETLKLKLAEAIAAHGAQELGVQIDGRIDAIAHGYRLLLAVEVAGHRSERRLVAADCESLLETAAWLVSLALESSATEAAAPQPEASSAAPDPDPQPISAKPASDEVAPSGAQRSSASDAVRLRWRLGVLTGGVATGRSGLNWTAGVRVGLQLDALLLELAAVNHFASSRTLDDAPGAVATFQAQELDATGCWLFGRELHAGPCLFAALTRTQGKSNVQRQEQVLVWLASGISASAGYSISNQLAVRLDGGIWLPLTARPEYEITVSSQARTIGGAGVPGVFARLGVDMVLQ